MRIALLLFDQVDLLDVGGPYEVFLTANRLTARRGQAEPFELDTAAAGDTTVTAYGGLGLRPSITLGALAEVGPEVLIVPGAVAIDEVLADADLQSALELLLPRTTVTASVCTGAFLLAAHGLLDEGPFTTHVEDLIELGRRLARPQDALDHRWVDRGPVVTAGGLSAGIDMALHLVERFADRALASTSAAQLGHHWDREGGLDWVQG